MTAFPRSAVNSVAACEHDQSEWEAEEVARGKAIDRAREHTRELGHREFDFSHRLRFEGEL